MSRAGSAIDVLVRFSRLASEARTGEAILPLLADAAIDLVGADAALVVQVVAGGHMQVAAARGVPAPLPPGWQGDADAIGPELGAALARACKAAGKDFAHTRVLPLVSSGRLFGALVMLCATDHRDAADLQVAEALVDLAAVAVGRTNELARLEKANAELRASREVLARSEKLRSLGEMAAGLTHDLKNMLNPLSLQAQGIQRAAARGDTARVGETVDEMKSVIHRGVEMLERLRAFSRQSPEKRVTEVDLNSLVQEAVGIAKPRMSSRGGPLCSVEESLGEVPRVRARAEEVVAALVNLVANAIDAMPDGGTITVRTAADAARGGASVTVADTGPGMTPEVQARVFEPFFTTKGTEGTGLGLAMVFATMQRHGGEVALETAPGKGAAFTLWFPAP